MLDDDEKPPRIAPKLKAAPKIRQVYWCNFHKDAQLPEFWKLRPVIIVSYKNTLYGTVTIIPCTTQKPKDLDYSLQLGTEIVVGKQSWAICDKITTLAVSRLEQTKNGIIKLPENEFNEAMKLVYKWLPKVYL